MAYHKGILGNGNNVSNGLLGTKSELKAMTEDAIHNQLEKEEIKKLAATYASSSYPGGGRRSNAQSGLMNQAITNSTIPPQQTINSYQLGEGDLAAQQNWMDIKAASKAAGGTDQDAYQTVINDPQFNYEVRQEAVQQLLKDQSRRQQGQIIKPSHPFGKQVTQALFVGENPNALDDLVDQVVNTFDEFGLTVPKNYVFRSPLYFSSAENRGVIEAKYKTKAETDFDRVPHRSRDWYEREWLLDDIRKNLPNLWAHPDFQSDLPWELRPDGTFAHRGTYYAPFKRADGTWTSYMGITTDAAEASRPTPEIPGVTKFRRMRVRTTGGTPAGKANQNTPGHEYGHYLDVWMSNGNGSLNKIALSLQLPPRSPHRDLTAHDYYVAWMNDKRTKHLDVVDKINTTDQERASGVKGNKKLNNPREILGKLYVTAMLNPITDPNGVKRNLSENIARALGTFFNPNTLEIQPHIQGIKDMRGNVIGAIANLLNQE